MGLAWEGGGLRVERHVAVAGAELQVEQLQVRAAGDEAVPFVALEHFTLGLDPLDPEVVLALPAATAYELDEHDGPTRPPADAATWPLVTLLDGGRERADRWPIERPRSRWLVLHDVPEGAAEVVNPRHGTAVAVRWDAAALPHLHVWHECAGGAPSWHGLCAHPRRRAGDRAATASVCGGDPGWSGELVHPRQPLRWWMAVRAWAGA